MAEYLLWRRCVDERREWRKETLFESGRRMRGSLSCRNNSMVMMHCIKEPIWIMDGLDGEHTQRKTGSADALAALVCATSLGLAS